MKRKDKTAEIFNEDWDENCHAITTHTLKRWLRKAKQMESTDDGHCCSCRTVGLEMADDIIRVLASRKGGK